MIETRKAAARKLGSVLLVDDGDELAATADESEDALARDEGYVRLHLRRLIALVDDGTIEAQVNLRRPRFSEVWSLAAR